MRLPTVTRKQKFIEDARELHEAIWFAHLAQKPYLVPGEPEAYKSNRAAVLQGNLHSFWIARGFRLSVRLRKDRRIAMTLTPAQAKQRVVRRPVEDLAWSQPRVA